MKKYFWVIWLLYTTTSFAQQLPNSSFENWSLKNEYVEADGWVSTNAYAYFGAPETCYPFEDAHSGQWSAKLEIRTDPITNDTVKAVMVLGSDYEAPGIAYSHRPAAFSFFYKTNLLDTGLVVLLLTHWNTSTHNRDTVAFVYNFFTTPSINTFSLITLPFSYTKTTTPDSCFALFLSSVKDKPTPGQYLIIDDLQFSGFLGFNNPNAQAVLKIYPNPTTGIINIETDADDIERYELLSVEGKVLLTGNQNSINTSQLNTGVYVLKVWFSYGQILTQRIVKQ